MRCVTILVRSPRSDFDLMWMVLKFVWGSMNFVPGWRPAPVHLGFDVIVEDPPGGCARDSHAEFPHRTQNA